MTVARPNSFRSNKLFLIFIFLFLFFDIYFFIRQYSSMARILVCGTKDKSSILFTRLIYLTCSLIGKAVRFECMHLCSNRSRCLLFNKVLFVGLLRLMVGMNSRPSIFSSGALRIWLSNS